MSIADLVAEKRLREYRKAFADSGWALRAEARAIAGHTDIHEGPVFYLCDVQTGRLHVVVAVKNVFDIAERRNQSGGFPYQDICDAFGSLYSDICNGNIELDDEAEDMLALGASLYIAGTQGYQLVQNQGLQNMHYLVIRHWDYANDMDILRPVPIKGKAFYAPEEIEGLVDQVLAIDRNNHPDRFKSAEVIPFKIKQRID